MVDYEYDPIKDVAARVNSELGKVWAGIWPGMERPGASLKDRIEVAVEHMTMIRDRCDEMIIFLQGQAPAVGVSPELDDVIGEPIKQPKKKTNSKVSKAQVVAAKVSPVPRKEAGKRRSFSQALKEQIVREYLAAASNVEAQAEILISYDVSTKQVSAWKQEMQAGGPRKQLPSRQPDTNEDRDK